MNVKIGDKNKNKYNSTFEVIDILPKRYLLIKYDNGYVTKTRIDHFIEGTCKSPYCKTVQGKGCIGEGEYKVSINCKATKVYEVWQKMLQRCYDHKVHKKEPCYIDCEVCEEWLNFQNFAKWFYENYKEGWQLDKDILKKGNKIYSPDNCRFVPREINFLFININTTKGFSVHGKYYKAQCCINGKQIYKYTKDLNEAISWYKSTKENNIKIMAEKYKNDLSQDIYEAMVNYKVDVNI